MVHIKGIICCVLFWASLGAAQQEASAGIPFVDDPIMCLSRLSIAVDQFGDFLYRHFTTAYTEYTERKMQCVARCWQNAPMSRLFGPGALCCPVPVSTTEGLYWLLDEAQKRLDQERKTPQQMLIAVEKTFVQYLHAHPPPPRSWLQGIGDLRLLAKECFPDDAIKQANSVLYMMVFYQYCSRRGDMMMFAEEQMPQKGGCHWSGMLHSQYTGVMCDALSEVDANIAYLFQDDAKGFLLDFIVSLWDRQCTVVLPQSWCNNEYFHPDKSICRDGLFCLFDEGLLQARNVELFLATMENIDPDFIQHMNETILAVLENTWVQKGPQMLVGMFFVLHDLLDGVIDINADILWASISATEKIEKILMAGAQRKVFDVSICDVMSSIHQCEEGKKVDGPQALQRVATDFVQAFMDYYKGFTIQEARHPVDRVKEEWIEGYIGDDWLTEVMQKVCDFAHLKDQSVQKVKLIRGGMLYRRVLPLTRKGLCCFVKKMGDEWFNFIPTKEVITDYTSVQKKQMVAQFLECNRIGASFVFPRKIKVLGLSTKQVLQILPLSVKEMLFGEGSDWTHLWRQQEIAYLWRKECERKDGMNVREAADTMMGIVSVNFGLEKRRMRTLSQFLRQTYGADVGHLVAIILCEQYIHKKSKNVCESEVYDFLEGKKKPTKKELAVYMWAEKTPLLLISFCPEYIKKYVFVRFPQTLLQRVIAASQDQHFVYFAGVEDFGGVYPQYIALQNKLFQEESRVGGVRFLPIMKQSFPRKLMNIWEDTGIFYLLGFQLLVERVVFQEPPVQVFKERNPVWVHEVIESIERSEIHDEKTLSIIRKLMPQDKLDLEQILYFVGLSLVKHID